MPIAVLQLELPERAKRRSGGDRAGRNERSDVPADDFKEERQGWRITRIRRMTYCVLNETA